MQKILNRVSVFFRFNERSTTFRKEIIGGLSTFMAMSYILAVNPGILSQSNGGHDYTGVFFIGTAVSAMVATLAMALVANVPIALAPGMGVNAFFAYTVASSILGMQVEQALVATFCSGVLYAIIAVTPFRNYLARILPHNVKLAIGAMVGLFLAYIGLSDSGIIVSGATTFPIGDPTQSGNWIKTVTTNTKMGNVGDPFVLIAIVTLILVLVLHFLKVKGSAVIAMVVAIGMLGIAYAAGVLDADKAFKLQDYKEFGKFGELSGKMWNAFGSTLSDGKAYIAVFVFLYIDFFDTTGTLFTIGEQANLNQEDGGDKWMTKANLVDACGTVFGSVMLTSTTTSFTESSVGVSQGARTGFASIITGSLFGVAIAIWPIMTPMLPITHNVAGVPFQSGSVMPVTGPILVMVGALMISQLKQFDWQKTVDIPMLFITLVVGMLSYSISAGIAAGIVVYYCLTVASCLAASWQLRIKSKVSNEDDVKATHLEELRMMRKQALNPVLIIMVIASVAYFATMPLYAY